MKNLYGRERVCASVIERDIDGITLNIGAGEVLWLENGIFLGNKNFISSDIEEKNLCKSNLAMHKIVADVQKLPFKNGKISQLIILDVLEHIKDDNKAISEIARVLRKSGKLIICVPNDTILSYLNPVRYVQHERHYSIKRITSLLKRNGFKIEKVFAGGGISELADLYTHFFIKYTIGKKINLSIFNKLRDFEYRKHSPSGNEIIVKATKI